MVDPEEIEAGKILYQECGTHLRHMLEWRHKLLLRFFVSNASFLIIIKWMLETKNTSIHMIIFLPFLLAAISSIAFFVMDKRTMKVVKVCRDTGSNIEKEIFGKNALFVNMGPNIEQTRGFFTYSGMLALIYLGAAIVFLLGFILSFIKYEGWKFLSFI